MSLFSTNPLNFLNFIENTSMLFSFTTTKQHNFAALFIYFRSYAFGICHTPCLLIPAWLSHPLKKEGPAGIKHPRGRSYPMCVTYYILLFVLTLANDFVHNNLIDFCNTTLRLLSQEVQRSPESKEDGWLM